MSVKRINSKIKEYFSDELMAELVKIYDAKQFITYPEAVFNTFTGSYRVREKKDGKVTLMLMTNNDKIALVKDFIKREWGTDVNFGTGTNRMAVIKDGLVFKIANDEAGCIDNLHEYIMAKELQPFVTKTYETNELICVCEYVKVLNKNEDFQALKEKIMEVLDELATRTSLMIDVGFIGKNKTNWGVRPDGTPVILDFGYVYTHLDGLHLTCMDDECIRKHGLTDLVYTDNYSTMVCPRCGKKVTTLYLQSLVTLDARRKMYEDKLDESLVVEKAISYFEVDEFGDFTELDEASDRDVTEEMDKSDLFEMQEVYKEICEEVEKQTILNGTPDSMLIDTKEKVRIRLIELEYGIPYEDMSEDMLKYDPYKNLRTEVNVMRHYRHEVDYDKALANELMDVRGIGEESRESVERIIDNMVYSVDEAILLPEKEIHNTLMKYIGEEIIEEEDEEDDYYDGYSPNNTPGSDGELWNSIVNDYKNTVDKAKTSGVKTDVEEENDIDYMALAGLLFNKNEDDTKVICEDEGTKNYLQDLPDWTSLIIEEGEEEVVSDNREVDTDIDKTDSEDEIVEEVIEIEVDSDDDEIIIEIETEDVDCDIETSNRILTEEEVAEAVENMKPKISEEIIDVKVDDETGETSTVIHKDNKTYAYLDKTNNEDENPFAKLKGVFNEETNEVVEECEPVIEETGVSEETTTEQCVECISKEKEVGISETVQLEFNELPVVEDSENCDPEQEGSGVSIPEDTEICVEPSEEVLDESEINPVSDSDDEEDELEDFRNSIKFEEDDFDDLKDYENSCDTKVSEYFDIDDSEGTKFFIPTDIIEKKNVIFTKVPFEFELEDLKYKTFPMLYEEDIIILGYDVEDDNVLLFTDLGNIQYNDIHKAYEINDQLLNNVISTDDEDDIDLTMDTNIVFEEKESSFTLENFQDLIDGTEFDEFDQDLPPKRSLKIQAREYNLKRF